MEACVSTNPSASWRRAITQSTASQTPRLPSDEQPRSLELEALRFLASPECDRGVAGEEVTVKESDLKGDTPTSAVKIKGLIDLMPFVDALVECVRQEDDEQLNESRTQIVLDGIRERINTGLRLVSGVDDLSEDTTAVAVAASLSGSPFHLATLLPLLTFSEGRARQALTELEEIKIIVALDEEYYAFAYLYTVTDSARDSHLAPIATPSQREREVARLITQGLTNYQIGMRLGLSQRTVETYVRRLFTKLDVNSRSQIAAWYMSLEKSSQ